MNRRDSLKALALAPFAAGFTWSGSDVAVARKHMDAAAKAVSPPAPQFFTEEEFETVKVLVDLILPRDERSGSATDLGVHEFIDFMMLDQPYRQVPMRGGLAWIDNRAWRRFGKTFLDATDTERRLLLDEIAYPEQARPEIAHGIAFFNSFRDLTATGFWTTQEGIADLQYLGNTAVPSWDGCPHEQLERLGVADMAWPQSDAPSWTDTEVQVTPAEPHRH